jgi:hypothetical protein
MKKLLAIALLTLTLGGCATQFGTRVETAWQVITQTSVSPTQIVIAGNAFDAVEVTATNYLVYCKQNVNPQPQCALVTRQRVISSVRAGRVARDALEPYVVSGKAGPIVIYNSLIEAIKAVKGNTPLVGAS